jgi:E3 ubiquitin-protein ligase makorin
MFSLQFVRFTCLTFVECIRSWRLSAPNSDPDDPNLKKTSKTCPMCRSKSDFIIPSSIWPSATQKKEITAGYLEKLKIVPCRYFEESAKETAPDYKFQCPFTNHCHYSHIHPLTKEPYTFTHNEIKNRRERGRRRGQSLELVLMEQMFEDMAGGSEIEAMEVFGFVDDDFVLDYAWE